MESIEQAVIFHILDIRTVAAVEGALVHSHSPVGQVCGPVFGKRRRHDLGHCDRIFRQGIVKINRIVFDHYAGFAYAPVACSTGEFYDFGWIAAPAAAVPLVPGTRRRAAARQITTVESAAVLARRAGVAKIIPAAEVGRTGVAYAPFILTALGPEQDVALLGP